MYELPLFFYVFAHLDSRNLICLRHVYFLQRSVLFFTTSDSFDPLNRILWIKNRVIHQYRQPITNRSIDLLAGVTVKKYSRKLVLPSTNFPGNKYSPVLISQDISTPGSTFFLGNKYSLGKKVLPYLAALKN